MSLNYDVLCSFLVGARAIFTTDERENDLAGFKHDLLIYVSQAADKVLFNGSEISYDEVLSDSLLFEEF